MIKLAITIPQATLQRFDSAPPPRHPRSLVATVTLMTLVLLTASCILGSQILEVGAKCTTDSDCQNEQLECVPAESANADRVCMPIDGGE